MRACCWIGAIGLAVAGILLGPPPTAQGQPSPPTPAPGNTPGSPPQISPGKTSESGSENPGGEGRDIALTYGIDGWDQVEAIQFTFNVRRGEKLLQRAWLWQVADNTVMPLYDTDRVALTPGSFSKASGPLSDAETRTHQQFINDSYWLLFPFQLVWSNPAVVEAGVAPLPIGTGSARRVTCRWPDAGGYTPGDAYDLYLDDAGLIRQWVYRKGGGPGGTAVTWQGHAGLGPIIVSLDHRNADDTFHLFFTDVRLKRKGEDRWLEPEPFGEGR